MRKGSKSETECTHCIGKLLHKQMTNECHKMSQNVTNDKVGKRSVQIASCWRSSTKYLGMPWSTRIQKHMHSQELTYEEGCKMMQNDAS